MSLAPGATHEASNTDGDQDELNARASVAKLNQRLRWGGAALVAAFLVPYEVVNGQPLFIWQVLDELSWGARAAAFALCFAGLVLLMGNRFIKAPSNRAAFAFAVFAGVLIVGALGADASAWDALSIPDGLGDRPGLLILTFATAGAGAALLARGGETRRRGRILMRISPAFAALVYLVPYHGFLPIVGVWELLEMTLLSADVRYQMGYGMIAVTTMLPLLVAISALVLSRSAPRSEWVVPSLAMTYALPAAMAVFVARHFMMTLGNSSVVASAMGLMPLVAGLGIAAAALEVLACTAWPSQRFLFMCGAGLALVGATMWGISRPPEKGVNWELSVPTADADELFGTELVAWNKVRRGWGVQSKKAGSNASAKEYVRVRKAGTDLLNAARKYNAALTTPFSNLVFETQDLDLAGRRWYRMIGELNEKNRVLGLPYYVDPLVDVFTNDAGVGLLFDLAAFRIERVRPFDVDGQDFATLRVRSLGGKTRTHNLLGFSRDFQPFAVVALDRIEAHVKDMKKWTEAEPPVCFEGDAVEQPELAYCGEQLAQLFARKGDVLSLATGATERHELQHQIDGPQLPIASVVHERMGPYATWARNDVNRELSAHLAELTAKEASPHLELIFIYGNAYRGHARGKYTHAAVMVLEALVGRSLEGEGKAPLNSAFRELTAMPSEDLRTRARAAWEELYGSPLPSVRAQ